MAKFSARIAGCLALLVILPIVIATNLPGIRMTLSSVGLNYAVKIATESMSRDVIGKTIEDQSGRSGHINYEISGIHVTGFHQPHSVTRLMANAEIQWAMTNGDLAVHGDFRYHYKNGFIRLSDDGNFDVQLSDVSLSIRLQLEMDKSGAPGIAMTSCAADIGKVKVKLHGRGSWFYNLFNNHIARWMKDRLKSLMCNSMQKTMKDMDETLHDAKLQVPLGDLFLLDYGLVKPPSVTPKYIQAFFKGEISFIGDKIEVPFRPLPMPASSSAQKMLAITVSDYALNTLLYAFYKHQLSRDSYDFSQTDLPGGKQIILKTSCDGDECIGAMVPQVAKLYPGRWVRIMMRMVEPPRVDFTDDGVKGQLKVDCAFYIRQPNSSKTHLFLTRANLTFSLKVTLEDGCFKGKIMQFKTTMQVLHSRVGPLLAPILQSLADATIKAFLIPKLNAAGDFGIPLPKLKHVKFINPHLSITDRFLLVNSDLQYVPETLYFKPRGVQ